MFGEITTRFAADCSRRKMRADNDFLSHHLFIVIIIVVDDERHHLKTGGAFWNYGMNLERPGWRKRLC